MSALRNSLLVDMHPYFKLWILIKWNCVSMLFLASPSCRYTGRAVLPPPRPSPPWRAVWSMSGRRCSRGLLWAPAALLPSAPCSAGRTDLSGPPTLWFARPGSPCCSVSLREPIKHTQTSRNAHMNTTIKAIHMLRGWSVDWVSTATSFQIRNKCYRDTQSVNEAHRCADRPLVFFVFFNTTVLIGNRNNKCYSTVTKLSCGMFSQPF